MLELADGAGMPAAVGPFERLIEANRMDQVLTRYETFAQLLDYCQLSAAPVGELVLGVFGVATPDRIALSDRVCAGLQVVEHLQDIAEDHGRGRVYMPREDLDRFGCDEEDLAGAVTAPETSADRVRGRSRQSAARQRGPLARTLPPGRGSRSQGSSPVGCARSTCSEQQPGAGARFWRAQTAAGR